ncbi:hypothetical protein AB0P21_38655 [Kribbella sp. NPDC056861]|uniref:hypothetical protein n=1 Tax=Kribbella sp. NPDC056861 TaxID=3154857 RepID=UPI003416CF17
MSDRLEITTTRDGQTWRQRFAAGRAVDGLTRVDGKSMTGTSVAFRPDPEIFESPRRIELGALDQLMEDLAALVPGLTTRLEVEERVRPPVDHAALLRASRSWQLRAEDGQDAVVIAFAADSHSHAASGRWLLNLRELVEVEELGEILDRALDQIVGQVDRRGVTVVVSAMMLSPEYSGPTRRRCDDSRLEQLIRRAVTDNLPGLLAGDPLLRAALLG